MFYHIIYGHKFYYFSEKQVYKCIRRKKGVIDIKQSINYVNSKKCNWEP